VHLVLVQDSWLEVGVVFKPLYVLTESHFPSAFVGLAVMVILFPVPGYVAKMIQSVQKEKMDKVGPDFILFILMWCLSQPQTDARVQTVTESKCIMRAQRV
jgi:hypothetical protein